MKQVIFEREKCIGCGTCGVICSSYWEMDEDGRANLKESTKEGNNFQREVDDEGCNKEAEQSCPVQCIHVNDN